MDFYLFQEILGDLKDFTNIFQKKYFKRFPSEISEGFRDFKTFNFQKDSKDFKNKKKKKKKLY